MLLCYKVALEREQKSNKLSLDSSDKRRANWRSTCAPPVLQSGLVPLLSLCGARFDTTKKENDDDDYNRVAYRMAVRRL